LSIAYYTAESLGVIDKIHHAFFDELFNERMNDSSKETLKKYFASKGVKEDEFLATFDSVVVSEKHKQANAIVRAYRIMAIPAIIVHGQNGIYITSIKMAGDEKTLINVIEQLVNSQVSLTPASQ